VLLLLRVVLRNAWPAVCFVAIFTVLFSLGTGYPLGRPTLDQIPVGLILYSTVAVALLRFGLIALATSVFWSRLSSLPYTLDFSTWYAGSTASVVLSVFALAAWGFYTSLPERPLWKGDLFE
jgi:hypothetical protein